MTTGTPRRPTRSKLGPLPRNSPANPLFPPLPLKIIRPSSRTQNTESTTSTGGGGDHGGSQAGSVEGSPVPRSASIAATSSDAGNHQAGEQVNTRSVGDRAMSPLKSTLVADPLLVKAEEAQSASGDAEQGEEVDWNSYTKRQREVRSFRTSFGAAGTASAAIRANVKGESPVGEDDALLLEPRALSAAPPSEIGSSLSSSTSAKESRRTQSGEVKAEPKESVSHDSAVEESVSLAGKVTRSTRSAATSAPGRSTRGTAVRETKPKHGQRRGRGNEDVTMEEEEPESKPAVRETSDSLGEGIGLETDDAVMEEVEGGKADVTRCVCGRDDIDVMMISCDVCQVWQHGACVGIWGDEEAPEEYYCEDCRPGLHAPLKRYLKYRAKHYIGEGFLAPTPDDLKHHHYPSDRIKPSQSKRWSDPSLVRPVAAPEQPPFAHRSSSQRHGAKSSRAEASTPPPSATGSELRRGGSRRTAAPEVKSESAKSKPVSAPRVRKSSISSDGSPPPVSLPPLKKRSTMNSRDAAYEAAIQASLNESGGASADRGRSSARPSGDSEPAHVEDVDSAMYGESVDRPHRGHKRKWPADEEAEGNEDEHLSDDDNSSVDSQNVKRSRPRPPIPGSKPKHPNQYTYRAPRRETHAVVQTVKAAVVEVEKAEKVKPPKVAPEIPRREKEKEKAASSRAIPEAPVDPTPIGPLTWHLPDHLQPFSHLLPTPYPVPLELVNPPTVDKRTGQAKDKEDTLLALGAPLVLYEQPTRVRFPGKRVTVGEMRKRVRSVLEYVGRIQVEEVHRGKRAAVLGLQDQDTGPSSNSAGTEGMSGSAPDQHTSEPITAGGDPSRSSQLMDELTGDLIAFQEMFEQNGSWFAGGGPGAPSAGEDGSESGF